MPLVVQQHCITPNSASYFARVLSDQPGIAVYLAKKLAHQLDAETSTCSQQNPDSMIIIEAIFNAQPVAVLIATAHASGCTVEALVVHPATRGRRVGRELLQKGAQLLPAPVEWAKPLRTLADKFIEKC